MTASERDGAPFDQVRYRNLETVLRPIASHTVTFLRASRPGVQDEFVTDVVQFDEKSPSLSPRDVLPAMPVGTNWRSALGRFSYYCVPIVASGTPFACVGSEEVIAHPTRGAYPVSRCLVVPLTTDGRAGNDLLAQALGQLADGLDANEPSPAQPPPSGEYRRSAADDPGLDAAMLRVAARHYSRGVRCFLRTLLLSDSLHPNQVANALMLDPPGGYLVGVAGGHPSSDSPSLLDQWGLLVNGLMRSLGYRTQR